MERVEAKPRPTLWWYALCLLGGPIVAALGYIAVKDEDPEMANGLIKVGIASFAIWLVVGVFTLLMAMFA